MKILPMKANPRENLGRRQVKRTRVEKKIPAIVYGHGIKSQAIEMSTDDFYQVTHTKAGENVVIQLEIAGTQLAGQPVVIKEVQHNPVTDAIEHVDFKAISLKDKIQVKVPLHVRGESVGVKQGGVLDTVHHEVEIECLPTDIPDRFDVDVSALDIGDALHAKDLKLPSGVTCLFDPEETVVAVHAPKAEETPAAAAVAEEGKVEPEVIEKGKKEDAEAAPGEAEKEKKA